MCPALNVPGADRPSYEARLPDALKRAGLDARVLMETDEPEMVDYMVFAPGGPVSDFRPFTRTKAVLSLWAGVEAIVGNQTLTQPLCRMVDTGLERGMVEWVTGHVMRYHLGMDAQIHGLNGGWARHIPPLAKDRSITILGLGALGAACARTLAGLGFEVHGWSRRPKQLEGITCHAGMDGLGPALASGEIVVLLLPATTATENILNAATLAQMHPGAFLLNPGRGALINEADLLAALDSGQITHATLDTFRKEPLPPDHAFWAHPKITVTPHIASETRPDSAVEMLVENIRRGEAGEPFVNLVDRSAGY